MAFSEKHDIQLLTHADPKGTYMNVNNQKLLLVNNSTVGTSNRFF